ncbi:MAG: DUF11 domain-containing protein [Chloroflexia bacterium]
MSTQMVSSNGRGLVRFAGPVGILLGLILVLASFNGSWGRAYGQTVPTPTPAPRIADPQISKTGDVTCCSPGDPVIFTIVVTNVGTADATNVVVRDTLPPELQLREVTTTKGTVIVSGNSFQVNIGAVAPGEIVTITVRAVVADWAPVDTVVTNTATLESDQATREDSFDLLLKERGACPTPVILPPTGGIPEPAGGTSLWLLLLGILLVLAGIALTLRSRRTANR